jgi:YVTN family beta-propeller protein
MSTHRSFTRATSLRATPGQALVVLAGLMLAAALAFASVPAHSASPAAPDQGFVYTADEHGNSLSMIDLSSSLVTSVELPIAPHNLQISADQRRLLATGPVAKAGDGHGHGDEPGRLLVFDAHDLPAGPRADIEVGSHPAHVVIDQAGELAFVTNAEDATVSVVDLAGGAVIKTIATGAYPHGLRLSPDGGELYVANVMDGSISVIDVEALAEVARIPVGQAPVQVGFVPDGSRVYVSLRDENAVAVIDTAAREAIDKIAVGRGPIQVYATPDGREVYVANEGTRDNPDVTVSVIDVASSRVVATITTDAGAHGVVASSDGRYVFVSNIHANSVSAIDTESREVVAGFAVGKGPNGITFCSGT